MRLADLPVLTKPELMERFDDLVTDRRLRLDDLLQHLDQIDDDALYLGEHRVMTSSGSSGRKAVFVYDRAAWSGIVAMFLRSSEWTNTATRFPRLRLAAIGGGSPTHMSQRGAQTMNVGLHRMGALSVTQPLPELVGRLNEFRPAALYGYPSIVGLLAMEQRAGVESVCTSSEPLSPALRERIAEAFGARVYDFYATTEGLYGHECPEGSTHLFDDMCIAENVDEDFRPVPPVLHLRDGAADAPARLRARVGARLEELGVQRPSVEVETVDALERSPGGKLQLVVAAPGPPGA